METASNSQSMDVADKSVENLETVWLKGVQCLNKLHKGIQEKNKQLKEKDDALRDKHKRNEVLGEEILNKVAELENEKKKCEKLQTEVQNYKTEKRALTVRNTAQFHVLKRRNKKILKLRKTRSNLKKEAKKWKDLEKNLNETINELHFNNLEQKKLLEEETKQRQAAEQNLETAMEFIRYITRECQTKTQMLDGSSTLFQGSSNPSMETELLDCKNSFKMFCETQNDKFEKWAEQMSILSVFREDFDKAKRALNASSHSSPTTPQHNLGTGGKPQDNEDTSGVPRILIIPSTLDKGTNEVRVNNDDESAKNSNIRNTSGFQDDINIFLDLNQMSTSREPKGAVVGKRKDFGHASGCEL